MGCNMKPLRKWNAPLNVPLVIAFCSLPCVFMSIWIAVMYPHLSALLRPLEDTSPIIHGVLLGLVGFMVIPWSFAPLVVALYFYQRSYDRKEQNKIQPHQNI
jgi:hypothetical protein